MKQTLLVISAVLVLVGTGVVHGIRSDRWGTAQAVLDAAERLQRIPDRVGDWKAEPFDLDEKQLEIAQVVGYLARRYVHQPTGNEVSVLLLCGRPGIIGAHTPDICYRGAGFTFNNATTTRTVKIASGPLSFFHGIPTKGEPKPEALSLWWGWSTDGSWQASKNPRVHYVNSPHLYKMYILRRVDDPAEAEKPDEPTQTFLEVFLPQLRQILSAA